VGARIELWEKLERDCFVGPLLYEQLGGTSGVSFNSCNYRLAIGPFCRILELVDRVCTPRLHVLRQRIIEARREAYKEACWEKHHYFMQVLNCQDLMVRDEALSYVLNKLDVTYQVFQQTYDLYTKNEEFSAEFSLIKNLHRRLRAEEEKLAEAAYGQQLLKRDEALHIFE